jgi:hypothetical protein
MLPKWAPILIEKPMEAEISEQFLETWDEDVVHSRSCYTFTFLLHIFNMVKFVEQVPDGFCFTMSNGTRQFLADGSNLITYSMVIFWRKEKRCLLEVRTPVSIFYSQLPVELLAV